MAEGTNEVHSERDDFEDALVAAIEALEVSTEFTAVSFTVELQASGQHPYRIATTEELYPAIGEVRTADRSGPMSGEISSGADEETGG